MYKKKSLLIVFEGIEGSGKSFQSHKLFKKIKKMGYPAIYSREPGGSKSAEKIRKVILTGKKNKFTAMTDTLLYLAARNEHLEKTIIPAICKKKIIILDRFIDSTLAYQVYGKKIDKSIVDFVHKKILQQIKPDFTFVLKLNLSKALKRMNKRKNKNRYDKFSMKFYNIIQKAFVKIAKTNRKKYLILDTSNDDTKIEKVIFDKIINIIKRKIK